MRVIPLGIVLIVGSSAHAENKSIHATVSGDVAATDNVFAATSDQNEADLSFTVRPGVLFGYDAPRVSHDLAFEGEIIEFLAHSEKPSVSLRGSERSSFITSRHTNLITSIAGSTGVLSALSSRQSPDQTAPQLAPLGRVEVMQGDASVGLGWSSGRDFSVTPTIFARASRTDGNEDETSTVPMQATIVKSAEAGASIGFERQFRAGDSVSLEAGASVLRLERDADPAALQGPRLDRQFNPRARVQWRHDFGKAWSSTLDGGVVFVYPFGTDPDNPTATAEDGVFPIAGAALAYTEVWGRASLAARRDVTPNLFVAQNTVNDSAVLSVVMPLPWLDESRMRAPKLVALGSLGTNRTQLINSQSSDVESSFLIHRLDVGVGYSPRPGFTYGVRYEFIYQTGDDLAVMQIPGFYRNTISFTFQIRYPERVAGGDQPKRKPGSGGVRADGKDLVPLGVDPVSTDVGEGEGEGEDGGD
ncbi:MAG: hypothetical protein ABI867_29535 [Kofleriaceae bacterium]